MLTGLASRLAAEAAGDEKFLGVGCVPIKGTETQRLVSLMMFSWFQDMMRDTIMHDNAASMYSVSMAGHLHPFAMVVTSSAEPEAGMASTKCRNTGFLQPFLGAREFHSHKSVLPRFMAPTISLVEHVFDCKALSIKYSES